jgi:hypothetical protein
MAWIWTGTFVVAFGFFVWRMVVTGSIDPFDIAVTAFLGVMIVVGFVRSVRAYQVTDRAIEVVRAAGSRINIDRADIEGVEAKPDLGSFFNMSPLGSGGLFGWSGKARIRRPSDIESLEAEVYGTNSANSVIIELKSGRIIVLTPADPSAFVAAVRGPEMKLGGGRRKGRK